MKKVLSVLLTIVILVALFVVSFGLDWLGLEYQGFFAKKKANIEREVFKNNKIYTEGMASDLAKHKMELAKEKDPVARKAIIEFITTKYADFDIDKLENAQMKLFLMQILKGEIE